MFKYCRTIGHCIAYAGWLLGQVVKESCVMAHDIIRHGRGIEPIVIYYPLRLYKERDIALFIASVTMTPGTLALGVTGLKNGDFHTAGAGNATGVPCEQRFLVVHVIYGHDPASVFASLAHMENRLVPQHASTVWHDQGNISDLVEKGRPGPRGFRGSHGGKAEGEGR